MAQIQQLTDASAGTLTIGDDLEVRRLGFGAMRITGKGVWGQPEDPDEARAVLRRVPELGINLIDTADSYGPYVSEELIAEVLHPYDGITVATKGGLERTGPGREWPRNGHPDHLREACEGSLKRLRVDRIDLYQLHSPDVKVPYEESVGAMKQLQDEGKVRHVGISNVSVAQLEQAREIVDVVSVQNRFNLAERDSEDVLERCEQLGIAFIPWFPLAAGDLAEPGGIASEIARAHDATTSQVALALAASTLAGDGPDPGHLIGRAPGGERGDRRDRAYRRRVRAPQRCHRQLTRLRSARKGALSEVISPGQWIATCFQTLQIGLRWCSKPSRGTMAIGTSTSRLSTYATGRVVPSAALLVRMRWLAETKSSL